MRAEKTLSWSSLFLVTFLAAHAFFFNEWLFAATKPSFLNDMAFAQQLQILLTTSALLTSLCFLALLPLVILSLIPPVKRYTHTLIQLGAWLPAVIFAILILLLVDNFTYTLFKFGIVSTDGWSRGLYGLGFVVVIILCYRRTLSALVGLSQRSRNSVFKPKWIFSLLAGALLLSFALLSLPNQTRAKTISSSPAGVELRPHILLITSDGVEAEHMSLYGYGRETTPNLRELAESALVAENAFANSDRSSGSVTSIYTGKYPAKTRVLFPPDILKGVDSYEHLPGILRSNGYKTVQITVPHYLDANVMNLVNGFDEVKTNSALHTDYINAISKVLPNDKALFIDEVFKRVVDRVRHIFFIWKMTNPYLLVTGMAEPLVDMERWETLRKEIQTARQPVFVHAHLIVTHGAEFYPIEQKFSAGQAVEAQQPWNDDFYDDSILEFDKNLGELIDTLTGLDLLDHTIVIIGSDHGRKWDLLKRMPLVIRFPHGQHAGKIQTNVQNLDIAPTVLDFIGLDQPDWMPGQSLIAGELEQRPIFGVYAVKPESRSGGEWLVNWEKVNPPFYQFGGATLVYCSKRFRLDLTNIVWETGMVGGSTAGCPPENEISDETAYQWIVDHLQQNGFDVSSLTGIAQFKGR